MTTGAWVLMSLALGVIVAVGAYLWGRVTSQAELESVRTNYEARMRSLTQREKAIQEAEDEIKKTAHDSSNPELARRINDLISRRNRK